nr:nucleotidyltransferase family protein [Lachnospiraceae bacterium]
MEKHLHNQTITDLFRLIRFALGGKAPSEAELSGMDREQILALAEKHSLGALTAYALENLGMSSEETVMLEAAAIRRDILFEAEKSTVLERLTEAGIWHMPLKGSVLKEYYPVSGLREMVDVDILFDPAFIPEVKAIMEDLGFETHRYGKGTVDEYYKEPFFNFEMHHGLFASNVPHGLPEYFRNVKEKLRPSEGSPLLMEFTPEDFYIYFIAHAFKHFSKKGTGLRNLTDTAVFRKHYGDSLDEAYIAAELEKIECTWFESVLRMLTDKLLGEEDEPLTPEEEDCLLFMASSGTYGSYQSLVNRAIGEKGKLQRVRQQLVLPMSTVKDWYPFFYKHKVLLPLLPAWRFVRGLSRSPQRIKTEMKQLLSRRKG